MGWQTAKQADSEPKLQDSLTNAEDLKSSPQVSADLAEEGPA